MSIKFLCVTLPHMSIGTGVVVAVTFQKIDGTPHAETGTQSDDQSLKNFDCTIKEIHNCNLLCFEKVTLHTPEIRL